MKPSSFLPVLALLGTLTLSTAPLRAQDQAADLAAANQAINDANYEDAAAKFGKFVTDYPTSTVIADAQLKLAYSYMVLAKYDEAIGEYKKLLAPPTPVEITELASGLLPQAFAGKASKLAETDGTRKTLLQDAIKAFNDFLTKYPKSDLVENSRYTLALCYFQTEQFDPAIETLRKNLAEFAQSESVQDSQYLLALMLATKANVELNKDRNATAAAFPLYDESQKFLADIIAKRTDLPLISDAQFQLGEVLFNRAVFTSGPGRPKLLQDALSAYRAVEPSDVVAREQQAKINALKGRTTAVLASGNVKAVQKLQSLIGREASKLEALKNKGSQRVASHLKMAQIFYQLSTPALPRYDETRVLLNYLEPLATNDTEKKTILYFRTMTYALQGNTEKAVAGYDQFMAQYKGDPIAENLPLAMGAMFTQGTTISPANPVKALDYFQQQVTLYPKSEATAAALSEQARAYSQLQRFDEAVKTYQTFLASNPDKSQAVRAQLGLAEVYRNTSKLDEADQVYAKIQKDYADQTAAVREAAFWRGFILVQQQKFPEAMKALATFVAVYPDDANLTPLAYFQYAQAQKGSGAVDTAVETFKTLVSKFPKSDAATFTFFERFNIAKEKNDIPAMDASMREFIAAYPTDNKLFNAYANMAQNRAAENKVQEAISIYYEFIDKNVNSPLVPTVLMQTSTQWAGVSQTLGRYASLAEADRQIWKDSLEKSIGDAERVIVKYPESPEVANASRGILTAQKEFVAANLKKNEDIEAYFTQFAAKFDAAPKTKSKILFTLASFIYERDPAKALAQMTAAYDPTLVYAAGDLDLYGSALIGEKKIDEAAAIYQKLAADYPNLPGTDPKQAPLAVQEAQATSLFGLGQVAQAKGDSATAAKNFAQLKELYPWSSKIFQANYGIAVGLHADKKYAEAAKLLEDIIKAQTAPNELRAQAMVLLGKIRRDSGDIASAIDLFIKTDYFYGGVPAVAAEGLFLGAQALEAQAAAATDPKVKAEAAAKAKKYYGELLKKYPDSPFAAKAKGKDK
ncbi:MAG TPA: tetratricopeptide repeat protein [Chthoniobacterales bacterium]|jgi:TolA-binding protein